MHCIFNGARFRSPFQRYMGCDTNNFKENLNIISLTITVFLGRRLKISATKRVA